MKYFSFKTAVAFRDRDNVRNQHIHRSICPFIRSKRVHLLTNRITTSGDPRTLSCSCLAEALCLQRKSQAFQRRTALGGVRSCCTLRRGTKRLWISTFITFPEQRCSLFVILIYFILKVLFATSSTWSLWKPVVNHSLQSRRRRSCSVTLNKTTSRGRSEN